MSTPQPARLPEQDEESSTRKEENLSTENQPRTHRRERRFELGFFVRRKVGRALAFYRQYVLGRKRKTTAPVQHPVAPSPPPPPSPEGEQTGVTKAFAVRSGEGQGGPVGGTDDEPELSTQGVLGEDDGGPIHGTSYEIGGFASITTETSTDDS